VAVDLDLYDVAGGEERRRVQPTPDAVRRAGGDDVAWRQLEELRDVRDDHRDGEDLVAGVRALDLRAVDARYEVELLEFAELVERHERGTAWR
jgi:hypothetical protein